ncbi:MAG: hypothetical protein SGJ20_13455 [Planctomycetota bacterium]|nr:hypothetical protein [Planctomycetota bacterium]
MATTLAVAGVWNAALSGSSVLAQPIDDLPAPIVTRQSSFSIPFTVPYQADPKLQPAEVRLFVSTDQGANWKQEGSVAIKPQTDTYRGSFNFRGTDGDYAFVIRTVDREGKMRSERLGRPELRVVVDTMAPRLDLQAVQAPTGEVTLSWQAVDPNLKLDSLKIEYQPEGGSSWRSIAIDPPTANAQRSTLQNSTQWLPGERNASLVIRAEVSDQAGNTTTAQARTGDQTGLGNVRGSNLRGAPREQNPLGGVPSVAIPAAPTNSPIPSAATTQPTPAEPAWNGPRWGAPHPIPSEPAPTGPLFSASPSNDPFRLPGGASTGQPPVDRGPVMAPPVRNESQFDRTVNPNQPGRTPFGANSPTHTWAPDNQTDLPLGHGPATTPPVRPADPPATSPELHSVAIPVDRSGVNRTWTGNTPPNRTPPSSEFTSVSSPARFDFALPQGERLRMVNSRSFELDYEVDAVGRSGISKVELWMTRDSGRTWTSLGVDNDNRSPFRASVDGEGVYGFRISVLSGSGLGGAAPKNGDLPEVWIGVDLTNPQVRLTAADTGRGDRAGEVQIRWDARDEMMARRPITLQYAQQANGPWSIIASGLDNSGSFPWRIDDVALDRVFLRIEARDEAGNVGSHQTDGPVQLERVVPHVRFRDVRPTGETSRGPVQYNWQR